MTAKILPRLKQRIQRFVMIPSTGGCFEIKVGDKVVYSKLQSGKFPDEKDALEAIEKALDA